MKYLINTNTKQILKEAKSIGQKWVDTQEDLAIIEIDNPYNEDGSFITLTDEHLKPFLLESANTTFESSVNDLVSSVPQSERLTWTKQEEEARAWLNDNSVSTPLIDGILSQRTKYTKQELVTKIIAKADAYATAIGTLTGIRQAQEDLLDE